MLATAACGEGRDDSEVRPKVWKLHVSLQTPGGSPLVNEHVRLNKRSWSGSYASGPEAVSDAGGNVVLEADDAGVHDLVRLDSAGDEEVLQAGIMVPSDPLVVRASPALRVRYEIGARSPDGEPVPDFTVLLDEFKQASGTGRSLGRVRAALGQARVELRGITSARATIIADWARGQPVYADAAVELTPSKRELTVALQKASPLRGRVVDSSGTPLPGVRVALRQRKDSRYPINVSTTTDAQGWFQLAAKEVRAERDLNGQPHRLQVDLPPTYAQRTLIPMPKDGEVVTITAEQGGEIAGRIMAPWLQSFPPDTTLLVEWAEPGDKPGTWSFWTNVPVAQDGAFLIQGVPRDVDVRINCTPANQAALHCASSWRFVVARAGDSDLQWTLEPARRLRGKILTPDPSKRVLEVRAARLGPLERVLIAEVGPDGSFSLDDLRPGDYRLTLWRGWTPSGQASSSISAVHRMVAPSETSVSWELPPAVASNVVPPPPDGDASFWAYSAGATTCALYGERVGRDVMRIKLPAGKRFDVMACTNEADADWVATARNVIAGSPIRMDVYPAELLRVELEGSRFPIQPDMEILARGAVGQWPLRRLQGGGYGCLVAAGGVYELVGVKANGETEVLEPAVSPGGDVVHVDLGPWVRRDLGR